MLMDRYMLRCEGAYKCGVQVSMIDYIENHTQIQNYSIYIYIYIYIYSNYNIYNFQILYIDNASIIGIHKMK